MNTTSETHVDYFNGIAGGSVTEGAGALATIALAIIGLAGVYQNIVVAVATIVIGGVFLMDGIAASAANRRLLSQTTARPLGMANGVTAEVFGGLAGIVLGILSFFQNTGPGSKPEALAAVALLVYGAALLISGGAFSRVVATQGAPEWTGLMSSGGVLIGLGAAVLGILAIIGLVPMTLVLVGLLVLGGGALFSGGAGVAAEVT